MGDRKRSHPEELDYHIAVSRFESAFEACTRLQDNDRESLMREMAQQMLRQVTDGSSNSTAASDTPVSLGADVPLQPAE